VAGLGCHNSVAAFAGAAVNACNATGAATVAAAATANVRNAERLLMGSGIVDDPFVGGWTGRSRTTSQVRAPQTCHPEGPHIR
jgi:hypothetical protein